MHSCRPLLPALLALALPMAVARPVEAQRRPTLPAAFYDVEVRGSMLDGDVSRIGPQSGARPTAAPPRGNGIGGGIIVPENSGVSRFIVAADSLLFRNGRDIIEIATSDFLAVDEVSGSATPHIIWVRVRYRHGEGERELYVRRYPVRDQSALRAALEAVLPSEARAKP